LEAKEKLDALFTKRGHVRLRVFRELDKEKIKPWNEDVTWWLLEHRHENTQWTVDEIMERLKDNGLTPEDTREMEVPRRGEDYPGHNWYKHRDNIRKLLNEMKIHTREGRRGRPLNN
jgi:hypothetical protein